MKRGVDGKTFRAALDKLIAFFVRHPKNSFVLVACAPDPELVRLYPGSRILELVASGLKLEPLACGLDACVGWFESL